MSESFEGKVAIVTGGGSGIGAAVTRRLADDGARVIVMGRNADRLRGVVEATGATRFVGDAADPADAERVVSETLAAHGRLDVLVANAGGHGYNMVGETTDEEWADSLRGNLDTAFVMARAALPALVDSRGSIVMVASLAALFAGPGVAGYTVAKHALIGLTRSLARDYGPSGVRVNAVCPGWVRTPMADAEMAEFACARGISTASADDGYRLVSTDVPLRRAAEPDEIASVIRFLASPESSFITGASIVADGGAHIVDLPTVEIGRAAEQHGVQG
ncbi:SDR family oxidoreductase [Nocardia sp. SYP-A9097]|uniref:SDR family NAD(P)-dependent oxidoreductase n=1 Tax=Nocardia sp. SYP-A9097 TaxID=2663237 RepID=UPI00129A7156|nr:SDR family NAD(P)-dependent oxidoreductase [Nocardia sp. SYP-A9097]MRH88449.1 SDR family oxidoreductase [Nocardia sp. SYP-A9097]